MRNYRVYLRVYDTAADFRAGRYHYATLHVTAASAREAEVFARGLFFSASLVNIEEESQ